MTKLSCIVIALVTACASGGKPGAAPDTGGDDQTDAPPLRPDAKEVDAPLPIDAMMPDAMQQPVTVTLQETTNNSVIQGNSAACNYTDGFGDLTGTADNTWYRAYQLSDFNITNAFHITQVTFGVEISSGATAQVKVGSYTGTVGDTTIDLAQVTPLNATSVPVPDYNAGGMVPVPITADIPAGGKLVVTIALPDYGSNSGKGLFIGSTNAGETKPGYWSSTKCGQAAPETTAAAGFPTENMIILVTGTHLM